MVRAIAAEWAAKEQTDLFISKKKILEINLVFQDDGGSYKGKIIQRCGGVGRNHAEALGRLGCESTFLTAVGDDEISQFLFRKATHYVSYY